MAKHIHADLMKLYYEDALETDTPWDRWEIKATHNGRWVDCSQHPCWHLDWQYRRKQKTININGFDYSDINAKITININGIEATTDATFRLKE